MPMDASSNTSKLSVSTTRSRRSGKSLVEKIRELGFNIRNEPISTTRESLKYVDIKTDYNESSKILVLTPLINLEQITFYQPVEIFDEDYLGKNFYKIEKFQTKSVGPKEIRKISDIEVKSFRPTKKIKFRKKKRNSSLTSKIETILSKGKVPQVSRDPSEESIDIIKGYESSTPKKITDLPEHIIQKIFFYMTRQERGLILSRVCKSWYYILKDPIFWKELEFNGNQVQPSMIIYLLKTHTTVEKLILISIPKVLQILQELCRCNHSITELGVIRCHIGSQDFVRIILHVVSCCSNLEVLKLKGMKFKSERFYLELGRLKNLRSLNLSGNKLIKSQDLITLSINCRALKDLRILDITPDNAQGPTLKDDDLILITSNLEKNLSTLKIDMQQLGNMSYQAILKCTRLQCLALKNCLLLTSDMFRQFPVLSKLKKLKITRAINLTPEDFQWVFSHENMERIEILDINGCWGVGSIGLYGISKNLTSLNSLSLKNCKSITGKDLVFLSLCPNLKILNLAHTNIDSNSLQVLPKHTKKLEELIIDPSMSKKSTIRTLKWLLPSLTIKLSLSEFNKNEKILKDI